MSVQTVDLEKRDFTSEYENLPKRWLSPKDLENDYGFSESAQAKMRMRSSRSTIPFSKIGSKYIRYDRLLIDAWLEEHQVQGA